MIAREAASVCSYLMEQERQDQLAATDSRKEEAGDEAFLLSGELRKGIAAEPGLEEFIRCAEGHGVPTAQRHARDGAAIEAEGRVAKSFDRAVVGVTGVGQDIESLILLKKDGR